MIKTVGILGFGALGVMYASEFQKVLGIDPVVIIADQERIDRYERDGVKVNGRPGQFHFVTPEKAGSVDLLILAVKYQGLDGAIESARLVADDHTIVMSFLNGIVSEQRIAERLSPKQLLYTTVQGMDTTRTGNDVVYTKVGSIIFGEKDGSVSPAVRAVDELFGRIGIAHQVSPDMVRQLYSKWMLNVGVNQSCAVFGTTYGGVQTPGQARDAMIRAMEEARTAARAEGIMLTEEERDNWVKLIDTLSPDGEPSMKQDVRAGRVTEVELFAGLVCTLGKKHGIQVPQNEQFYEELTAWNRSVSG